MGLWAHRMRYSALSCGGMLGYRVGDIIEWKVPAGIVKLKVEKILYQPEANGKDLS